MYMYNSFCFNQRCSALLNNSPALNLVSKQAAPHWLPQVRAENEVELSAEFNKMESRDHLLLYDVHISSLLCSRSKYPFNVLRKFHSWFTLLHSHDRRPSLLLSSISYSCSTKLHALGMMSKQYCYPPSIVEFLKSFHSISYTVPTCLKWR